MHLLEPLGWLFIGISFLLLMASVFAIGLALMGFISSALPVLGAFACSLVPGCIGALFIE